MKAPVIGALLGTVVAVLAGIPSFTISDDAESFPPLFNFYCGDASYFMSGKCEVGPGVLLVVVILAAVGAGIGYAISRRRPSG